MTYLKGRNDVIIGYKVENDDYNCRLTSANVKELANHELGIPHTMRRLVAITGKLTARGCQTKLLHLEPSRMGTGKGTRQMQVLLGLEKCGPTT